jgi:hypothetical protein
MKLKRNTEEMTLKGDSRNVCHQQKTALAGGFCYGATGVRPSSASA